MSTLSTIYDIRVTGNAKNSITETTGATQKLNTSMSKLGDKIRSLGSLSFGIHAIAYSFNKLSNQITRCTEAYKLQAVAETRLATIMRRTMGAMDSEIDSIKKLAAEQQKLGVIGDEIQLTGAQELATYLTKASNIRKLLPVMNDMLAQQYGLNATSGQAVTIAQMMGKVLDGQVGALSRVGYRFTEAQEHVLKFGNEEQRVAMLAQVITQYVGGVNEALAQTPEGKLKQHANDVGDLKERWGALFVGIQAAILPLREKIGAFFEKITTWLETNKEKIEEFVTGVVKTLANAFSTIINFVRNHITAIMSLAKVLLIIKVYTIAYTLTIKACAIGMAIWKAAIVAFEFASIAFRFGLATATRLMWGFNAATKASGIGLLIGVVTAAITAFSLFRKKTDETTKALNDAKKVANDYYAQERTQLDMIFAKLRQTNPKSKERNDLVNELMQMYPELNRQQLDELRNTNNLAVAYETLAESIVKKARIKGMESALENLSAQIAPIDMAIEKLVSERIKRDNFKSDESYAAERERERSRFMSAMPTLLSKPYESELSNKDYGVPLANELVASGVLEKKSMVGRKSKQIADVDDALKNGLAAYKKIYDVQSFLSSYMFQPTGISGGSGILGSTVGSDGSFESAATEITGGGKGVKNFYITIGNLLGENTNIFQSSKDNPETAGDFLERLSYALQDVVNDANYAAS
ncbi:MAG: hypothetical protein LBT56_00050 [Prevotellaceae bacterium]|jgi:hypothetical protein|nr:hypothetical protein [Prevotellaceae bacterium]